MFKKNHFLNLFVLIFILFQVGRYITYSTTLHFSFAVLIPLVLLGLLLILERYIPSFSAVDLRSGFEKLAFVIYIVLGAAITVVQGYSHQLLGQAQGASKGISAIIDFLFTGSPKLIGLLILSFALLRKGTTEKELIYRGLFILAAFYTSVNYFEFLLAACFVLMFVELDGIAQTDTTGQKYLMVFYGGIGVLLSPALLLVMLILILFYFRKSLRMILIALAVMLLSSTVMYFLIPLAVPINLGTGIEQLGNPQLLALILPALYIGWSVSHGEEALLGGGILWVLYLLVQFGGMPGLATAGSGAVLLLIFAFHEYETDKTLGRIYPHKSPVRQSNQSVL